MTIKVGITTKYVVGLTTDYVDERIVKLLEAAKKNDETIKDTDTSEYRHNVGGIFFGVRCIGVLQCFFSTRPTCVAKGFATPVPSPREKS